MKQNTKKLKMPTLMQSDSTIANFFDYFTEGKYKPLRQKVNERIDTVKVTDTSSRVFHHWLSNGLMPLKISKGSGWYKFTLIERIWLEAIKRFRQFGLSLGHIAKACEQIMQWDEKHQAYMNFEYYVIEAWFGKEDPYILIFSDGKAAVGSMEEIEFSKMSNGNKDMLLISIKSILEQMGLNIKNAKTLLSLSDEEIDLLLKIRAEDNDEVKVKVGAGRAIDEIESTQNIASPPPNYQIHRKVANERLHGDVAIKYENGVPQFTQIKRRKKYKK